MELAAWLILRSFVRRIIILFPLKAFFLWIVTSLYHKYKKIAVWHVAGMWDLCLLKALALIRQSCWLGKKYKNNADRMHFPNTYLYIIYQISSLASLICTIELASHQRAWNFERNVFNRVIRNTWFGFFFPPSIITFPNHMM